MLGSDVELIYGVESRRPQPRTDALITWLNAHVRATTYLGVALTLPALLLTYIMSQVKLYLDFRIYLMGAAHLTSPTLYLLHYPIAGLSFTYPPIAALFFWPATWLPFHVASFVWTSLTFVALYGFVTFFVGSLRPDLSLAARRASSLVLLGPLFFFEPILENFHFGQVNIVLALLTIADVIRRPRRAPQGVLIGIATAIKLVPGIFLVYLLVRRQYRAVATAAITIGALEGLMFLVNYRATVMYWKTYAFDVKRIGGQVYNSNQSIRGAAQRLVDHLMSNHVLSAWSALAVVVGLACAVLVAAKRSETLAVVLVGFAGDLASPISWTHHLVWFIPLVLWLLVAPDRPRFGVAWATVVSLVLWTGLIWLPPHDGSQPFTWSWWEELAGNADFFIMVITLVVLALAGFRRAVTARR